MAHVVNGWQALLAFSPFRHWLGRRAATGGAAPRVLAFVSQGHSRLLLQTLSADAGWTLTLADRPPAAITKSGEDLAPIILFDREFSPGEWREAVGNLSRRSPRPHVILLSPNSDGNLWEELQRVGGSDILRTPLDRERALQAVGRAWSLWRSQQQLRLRCNLAESRISR